MVRLQGHLPCPTPLPEHLTQEFSSLCQQAPLWRRKPYTPMYTPQLRHNLITTSTQLLHTNLLHTNSSSHLSTSHLSTSHQSSSHQSTSHLSSSQLHYFTTNQLLLPTQLLFLLNYLLQTQHNFTNNIYTMHNYSSILLELSCTRSILLLHFG